MALLRRPRNTLGVLNMLALRHRVANPLTRLVAQYNSAPPRHVIFDDLASILFLALISSNNASAMNANVMIPALVIALVGGFAGINALFMLLWIFRRRRRNIQAGRVYEAAEEDSKIGPAALIISSTRSNSPVRTPEKAIPVQLPSSPPDVPLLHHGDTRKPLTLPPHVIQLLSTRSSKLAGTTIPQLPPIIPEQPVESGTDSFIVPMLLRQPRPISREKEINKSVTAGPTYPEVLAPSLVHHMSPNLTSDPHSLPPSSFTHGQLLRPNTPVFTRVDSSVGVYKHDSFSLQRRNKPPTLIQTSSVSSLQEPRRKDIRIHRHRSEDLAQHLRSISPASSSADALTLVSTPRPVIPPRSPKRSTSVSKF
ncbi:hypothetical protein AMATHDRAFT_1014 [Amanita thiersii Skay4041]|uniref:Uncharacterized protein n=1 Tax=Amanita thiersii Skay4041 TaxID=703135 RepID=A0A2A9P067_9AGAR|nr:hypothetical protein AMATHDRAFT_1014 [Amanita thiersii Skay4041]